MNYGEILFDMNEDQHPTGSEAKYVLKRWTKYTIYSKSGPQVRSDNPVENLYATNSVYLYDYISATQGWYSQVVYTSSVVNTDPSDIPFGAVGNLFTHNPNTLVGFPNATAGNFYYTQIWNGLRYIYGAPSIPIDAREYFEVVNGYPRNHFTHKRDLFGLYRLTSLGKVDGAVTSGSYMRCQQTIDSTVGVDGLEDGSLPVQSTQVGNLNLIQSPNVINQ